MVASSLVTFFLLLRQVDREVESSSFLAQRHLVVGRLNLLQREIFREQDAVDSYLASADAGELAEKQRRNAACKEILAELALNDREISQELKSSLSDWEVTSQRLLDQRARGPVGTLLKERQAQTFRAIFQKLESLASLESQGVATVSREQSESIHKTLKSIAALDIALLIIFTFALLQLYSSVSWPLKEVARGLRVFREGNLSARVSVTGKNEIGYLGSSFNDMAVKIQSMISDLKRLDEIKNEFLSIVSHELRTPLTSVRGYVKVLLNGDAGELKPEQKEFLQIVHESALRLNHMVDNLLDVARIQAGAMEMAMEPVELRDVLKETIATIQVLAREKGLKVQVDLPATQVLVRGDRLRLIQVFTNLLSNAVKYTSSGEIAVRLEMRGLWIRVSVRDTGQGLSPDEVEHLFQKFYRTPGALASNESGTGLGLVIAQGIVEAHQGRILVESTLGQGTLFQVELPTHQEKA